MLELEHIMKNKIPVKTLGLVMVGIGLAVHGYSQTPPATKYQLIPGPFSSWVEAKADAESRGGYVLEYDPQRVRGSVAFNGINSYATMSQSFLNGATVSDFTIEFWIKNNRPEIYQHFGGKTEFWKEWGIGFDPGGKIGFMHAWPNTYYTMRTTNGVLIAGQWQHVAVVGRGTLGSIYVDGILVTQENCLRGQISFNAAPSGGAIAGITFGFRDNTTLPDDGWFSGELADFRIWDIALSAAQVASLSSTDPLTTSQGLRHWIPFNEGKGSTFTDIIGGLQGQLFNTTWITEVPSLTIKVETVRVTMHVKPAKKYQLEASLDLKTWSKVLDPFVAASSEVVQSFNAIEVGRYFRLVEIE